MRFESLRTGRLLLRPVRASDAVALASRRSDPAVAEFQNWLPPYPLDHAEELIAVTAAMDGPANDEWWMLTVADADDTEVFGDLVVHLTWEGRCAEIGYTLAQAAWGHGYAVEAVDVLVDWLWSHAELTRLHAMMHPDNVASAQVLERTGFDFEGRTALSFWVGDDNSDDGLYGMTRSDWQAWRSRRRTPPDDVQLVEITSENWRPVYALRTHKSQERFVGPMANSFANALFPSAENGRVQVPWMRAIVADDEPVGFVMMTEITEAHPEPHLWRLLIDRKHQRRGVGGRALDLAINAAAAMGGTSLMVSWVPGRGSPEPMYLGRGFVPTGEIDDGEVVARLHLSGS